MTMSSDRLDSALALIDHLDADLFTWMQTTQAQAGRTRKKCQALRDGLDLLRLTLAGKLRPSHFGPRTSNTLLKCAEQLAAAACHITVAQIHSKARPDHIVKGRHLAIHLAHSAAVRRNDIAYYFGIDLGSIHVAVNSTANRIDTDPAFAALAQSCLTQMNEVGTRASEPQKQAA